MQQPSSLKFIIFGSPSSLDYDVLVLCSMIPSVAESKALCKAYEAELSSILVGKKINVNLGIAEYGQIIRVFKGTADEVNNSLLETYDFHRQWHDNPVILKIPRDPNQKVLRALRVVLSFYSRTQYRTEVKQALRSDLWAKVKTLESMDLSTITDFDKGENRLEDVAKNVAFQMGQSLALLRGQELYTKESIAKSFPALAAALRREPSQEKALETFKQEWLREIRGHEFKKLTE